MRRARAVALTGLALGAAALGVRRTTRRALPRPGIRRVAGLDDEVEILRDRWGVPHVYARTEHDLFFGNAVVHAEDRLWQMEINRRAALGRLSEVFGESTFEIDRFMRRIGIGRAARAEVELLDGDTRAALEAYVAGVNWAMESRPRPIELLLVRHHPEPWTLVDSLAWAKLMGWGLAVNWDAELARLRLLHHLGPERAAEVDALYPTGAWLTADYGGSVDRAARQVLESYQSVRDLTGLGSLGGSNAWAVSASRSATGGALLAGDPHLAPGMPATWYEISLDATDPNGDGYRVAGASLAGLPGVVIGHNGHIAWSVTASLADVQDMYVEQVDPANPRRFRRGDGWEEARLVREEIRVKGRPRWHTEEVLVSSNGPVVSPLFGPDAPVLSLRASGLDAAQTLSAGVRLNRARGWEEFRAAMADWAIPSLSVVYADRAGNVGYQMVGRIPRRKKGVGALPAPGWDPDYGWDGYLTLDELPHVFNPPGGVVANANNRPSGDECEHAIGVDWCDAWRIGRIAELLRERDKHDVDSMARIQLDVTSTAAREIVARLRRSLADERPIDPLEREALPRLLAWKGELSTDSAEAAIYGLMRVKLLRFLHGPEMGDVLDVYLGERAHRYGGLSSFAWRASSALIRALDDPSWVEKCGHVGLTWRDALLIALGEAVSELRLKQGESIDGWRWGVAHTIAFDHPLSRVKQLKPFLSRGPFPIGGDVDTPLQAGAAAGRVGGNVSWAPSYRQVVDFGDLRRSVSVLPTGQSGQPASPHYDDQLPLWLRGRYHPMLWDRADVEEHMTAETRLIPTDERWR